MPVEDKYQEWINRFSGQKIDLCMEICYEMKVEFPELRVVSGWITLESRPNLLEDHWWLVDPEGNIVDPTTDQWNVPIIEYVVSDENGEPTGRCAKCNAFCYDGDQFCSWDCERSTLL